MTAKLSPHEIQKNHIKQIITKIKITNQMHFHKTKYKNVSLQKIYLKINS